MEIQLLEVTLYTMVCTACSGSSIGPPNLNIHLVHGVGVTEDLLNKPT